MNRPRWRVTPTTLGHWIGGDWIDLATSAATVALVLAAVWLGLIH